MRPGSEDPLNSRLRVFFLRWTNFMTGIPPEQKRILSRSNRPNPLSTGYME